MYKLMRLLLAASVLSLASLTGCLLSAQEQIDHHVLRAAYVDVHPYSFAGGEAGAQGYSIDVMRQMAQAAGYDIRFVPARDAQQMMEMLEQGAAEMTAFVPLTPEWRDVGFASAPLGQYAQSVYVRRDHNDHGFAALSGQRIGVGAKGISPVVAALIPGAHIIEYPSEDALLLPLLRGEVSAVVAVAETFNANLRTHFIEEEVRRLSPTLAQTPYGVVVRRDLPNVYAAFQQAIRQPGAQLDLTALHARWFGTDRGIFQHPWFSSVAMVFGGTALALISLTVYALRLRRSAARLRIDHRANQLLIGAFDNIRAAITIFDSDMKALHWNSGFECRFPRMVPVLKGGATIEQSCLQAYRHGDFMTDMSPDEMVGFASGLSKRLRNGESLQWIVETPGGYTFDLSMFRLGARHYAAIWVDVSELHHQQERISAQSRELSRTNQQLLAFSSMAAHDLKAPLMQQSTLIDFIREDISALGIKFPVDVETHFAVLKDLSRRMSLLVGDLLEYAKADADLTIPVCFAPAARLEGVLKLAVCGRRMNIKIEPDMPDVSVDPTSFDLVMRNLISNAAKHHDQGEGGIILRGYKQGHMVVIEVEDDGPGIATKDHARVFEPFARLTRVEGSGLGLALVRKAVVAWGGTISLRAASGRGCIFSVTLPCAPDPVADLPPRVFQAGLGPHDGVMSLP